MPALPTPPELLAKRLTLTGAEAEAFDALVAKCRVPGPQGDACLGALQNWGPDWKSLPDRHGAAVQEAFVAQLVVGPGWRGGTQVCTRCDRRVPRPYAEAGICWQCLGGLCVATGQSSMEVLNSVIGRPWGGGILVDLIPLQVLGSTWGLYYLGDPKLKRPCKVVSLDGKGSSQIRLEVRAAIDEATA